MAETKREEWEIDRDRAEIAALLARYRTISHKRISDILYGRRTAEYKEALKELDALDENSPIPSLPAKPYKLSRQMVDYDVRAIREDWRRHARRKYEDHLSDQLASALDLHALAHEGYERSQKETGKIRRKEKSVELTTTVGALLQYLGADTDALLIPAKDLRRKVRIPGARHIESLQEKMQLIGDPRFLMVVDRAQARIDKLLRLEAPPEIDPAKVREALAALLGVPVEQLPTAAPDGPAK